MRKFLSYVYSYYESPLMFRQQLDTWKSYPTSIQRNLDIFVTDDCSTDYPLRDIAMDLDLTGISFGLHLYELTEKVQWNWLACRNLGAQKANSLWLILTDIDHLITKESLIKIIEHLRFRKSKQDWIYLFTREDAPYYTKYKPHNDSFMMTKDMYWKIGGYDEELSGNYGTSGRYRVRAFEVASGHTRLPIPLTRYPRGVVSDASTTKFIRKGPGRDPEAIQRILKQKSKEGRESEIRTLSFPYRKIR